MPFYDDNTNLYFFRPGAKFLSLDGSNLLLDVLMGVQGTEYRPSWAFQGDNKTGDYWISEGKKGFSSKGWLAFSYETGHLSFYDRNKNSLDLTHQSLNTNRTQTFQNADGTIALTSDVDQKATKISQTTYASLVDSSTATISDMTGITAKCLIKTEEGQIAEFFILNGVLELTTPSPIYTSNFNITAAIGGALSSKINIYQNGSDDLIIDNRMGSTINWSSLLL